MWGVLCGHSVLCGGVLCRLPMTSESESEAAFCICMFVGSGAIAREQDAIVVYNSGYISRTLCAYLHAWKKCRWVTVPFPLLSSPSACSFVQFSRKSSAVWFALTLSPNCAQVFIHVTACLWWGVCHCHAAS